MTPGCCKSKVNKPTTAKTSDVNSIFTSNQAIGEACKAIYIDYLHTILRDVVADSLLKLCVFYPDCEDFVVQLADILLEEAAKEREGAEGSWEEAMAVSPSDVDAGVDRYIQKRVLRQSRLDNRLRSRRTKIRKSQVLLQNQQDANNETNRADKVRRYRVVRNIKVQTDDTVEFHNAVSTTLTRTDDDRKPTEIEDRLISLRKSYEDIKSKNAMETNNLKATLQTQKNLIDELQYKLITSQRSELSSKAVVRVQSIVYPVLLIGFTALIQHRPPAPIEYLAAYLLTSRLPESVKL